MVLVDSSVWIEASRRRGDLSAKVALEALLEAFEAAWSSPIRLEVLGGARRDERAKMETLFAVIPYYPVEEADWDRALRHGWKMRDGGQVIPWNDLLIGAVSLRLGFRVFARDAHFEAMKRVLGLRLYVPGPGGRFSSDLAGGPPS